MRNVEWLQSVMNDLTQLWLQADSETRKAITKSCHVLEKRLANDPENEGESRDEGRRITFEQPLAVVFRAESNGWTVTVLEVQLMRRRSK